MVEGTIQRNPQLLNCIGQYEVVVEESTEEKGWEYNSNQSIFTQLPGGQWDEKFAVSAKGL